MFHLELFAQSDACLVLHLSITPIVTAGAVLCILLLHGTFQLLLFLKLTLVNLPG